MTDDSQCITVFRGGNKKYHRDYDLNRPVMVDRDSPEEVGDDMPWKDLSERHFATQYGDHPPYVFLQRVNAYGMRLLVGYRVEYVRYRDIFRPQSGVKNLLAAIGVTVEISDRRLSFDFSMIDESRLRFCRRDGVRLHVQGNVLVLDRLGSKRWKIATLAS